MVHVRKNRGKYVEGKQESPKKIKIISETLFMEFFTINASPKSPVLLRIKFREENDFDQA